MREIKFRAWDKDIPGWVEGINDSDALRLAIAFPKSVTTIQYVGRKDKNGIEIYTGYFIKGMLDNPSVPTMGEVAYDAYWSAFGNRNLAGFTFLYKIRNIEIIGNKFENPELLPKPGKE